MVEYDSMRPPLLRNVGSTVRSVARQVLQLQHNHNHHARATQDHPSMGSPVVAGSRAPAAHLLLLVVAVALTAGGVTVADAATFVVANACSFPVWPAAIPAEGGSGGLLEPGETWVISMSAGATSGRIWGRTECRFAGEHGACGTGAQSCQLSGKPPATLVDGAASADHDDFYDVSVVDGFNDLPMDFACEDKAAGGLQAPPIGRCGDPGCAGANRRPGEGKVRTWTPGGDYRVVFCPQG
ncbi:hypothetical protein U9M48_037612 [Paspalum notatum var. saurae]|uniref:Thaumatin-like protein n=1 Tax=Paspalum notatum var. saurae TaxID=547442 RepID=A0AAQ3UF96_PASNO